jgi:endonuclease YncB( thermonuclease family)
MPAPRQQIPSPWPARLAVVLVLVIACLFPTESPAVSGSLTVVGSRTFVLSTGERIRLFDIVTPDAKSCSCVRECLLARETVDFLQRLLSREDATIRLERYGIDPDGATRVKMFIDSRDVATLLIDRGLARPATITRSRGWC